MENAITNIISGFSSISLQELNSSMALMEREETKFMIEIDKLVDLLQILKDDYSVLSINGQQIFTYDNVYFDTKDNSFYTRHQSGRKIRTKVRSRCYVDSSLYFFEYKQRNNDKISKYRYEMISNDHGKITLEAVRFFQGIYESIYGEKFAKLIFPTMNNSYNRITLCSKTNNERITIDFNLGFKDIASSKTHAIETVAIIECKAGSVNSESNRILEEFGLTERKACSKYCLGMHYLGKVSQSSHFAETIAFIDATRKIDHDIVKLEQEIEQEIQASLV